MKKNFNLKFCDFIISFYDETPKDMPLNVDELILWFKSKRLKLSEIKEFPNWIYSIDEKNTCFKIERGDKDRWEVYKQENPDEVYFPFNCTNGKEFISTFKQKLNDKLIKENLDPYSLPSPDYPVKIDI